MHVNAPSKIDQLGKKRLRLAEEVGRGHDEL
jgi:hypothetical protein